jgi:hypothetical protein
MLEVPYFPWSFQEKDPGLILVCVEVEGAGRLLTMGRHAPTRVASADQVLHPGLFDATKQADFIETNAFDAFWVKALTVQLPTWELFLWLQGTESNINHACVCKGSSEH